MKKKTSTKSTVDGSWHIFGSRTHIKYALQVNPPAIRSSFMYVKQRNEKSFLSYCLRSTWVSHLTLTSHEELLWAKKENVLLNAYRYVGPCFLQKNREYMTRKLQYFFLSFKWANKKRNCVYFKPSVIISSHNRVIKSPSYPLTGGRRSSLSFISKVLHMRAEFKTKI